MKTIEQKKTSILRIFEDNVDYGDKYVCVVYCTYCGKYNDIVYLEGLQGNVDTSIRKSIFSYLRNNNVHLVRWTHTNNNHKDKEICYDLFLNRLIHVK